jgi:hypothetical protein
MLAQIKTPPIIFGGVHKKDSKITFFYLQSVFYSSVLNIAGALVAPPILPACDLN